MTQIIIDTVATTPLQQDGGGVALLIYTWSTGNNVHSKRAIENTLAPRRARASKTTR